MFLRKTLFKIYLINLCTISPSWYWSCLCNIWQIFLWYILFSLFYEQFSVSFDIYCHGVW